MENLYDKELLYPVKERIDIDDNKTIESFNCTKVSLESYKCYLCPDFQTFLLSHLKQHTKEGHTFQHSQIPIYKCDKCHLETYSNYLMIRHYKIETCSKNNLNNKSPISHYTNSTKFKIKDIKVKSILLNDFQKCQNRILVCPHCPHTTTSKKYLRQHYIVKHMDSDEIEWHHCDKCPYKAKIRRNLQKHVDKHHSDKEIKWFYCDRCPYKVIRKRRLREHIFVKHSVEKLPWLRCHLCNFKTKKSLELDQHLKEPHTEFDEWFDCERCPFKTKWKYNLKKHINIQHANIEDIQWFYCDKCDFKSKRKDSLKTHIFEHHNDSRPYKCAHCDYKAKRKQHLIDHLKKHGFEGYKIRYIMHENLNKTTSC